MKIRIPVSCIVLLFVTMVNGTSGDMVEFEGIEPSKPMSKEEYAARIQGSFGFLSEREPQLNQAEYAILEKFVPYLELDPEFALSMIEGLTKNNRDLSASFDYMLGNLYVQSDRLKEAEQAYKGAIGKYPDYLRAWKALGLLYMNHDDIDNSLKALNRTIRLGDTDPMTFGQIGYCFYVKGEYLSSLSAYSQAILYEPEKVEWMLGKVSALKELNDYEQANIILRDMVRRSPKRSNYWMELANNWVRLGKPLKAAACLEFLRGGGLQTSASMEMLGTIYVNESLSTQAYDVYNSMIESGTIPNGSSLLRCARKLQKDGFSTEAEALVSRLMAVSTDLSVSERVSVLHYQCQTLVLAGRHEEARKVIAKALQLKPDDTEAMIAMGRIEYHLGNGAQALIILAEAEHFAEAASEAAVMQAQIMVAEENYRGAEEKLENALLNGGDIWVERYYNEVKLQARKAELDKLAGSQSLQ